MLPSFAGTSILLIPFSFDFVDSLCLAAVLGFLCEVGNKLIARQEHRYRSNSSRVAVYTGERGDRLRLNNEVAAVQTGPEEDDTPKQASSLRDHFSSKSYLLSRSESRGLERRRASTMAAEFETAPCQAHAPRPSFFSQSVLLSSMSSRNSLREPRPNPPIDLPTAAPHAGPDPLHWDIALAAMAELVLSAINPQQKEP